FITFSTSTDPSPLAVVFTGGSPALMMHVLIAVVLLILALQVLVTAIFINRRPVVVVASAGFASIALAFFTGIAFVYSGYENDSLSYLMAVGFLFGLIIYGYFAGREERPTQTTTKETTPSNTIRPRPLHRSSTQPSRQKRNRTPATPCKVLVVQSTNIPTVTSVHVLFKVRDVLAGRFAGSSYHDSATSPRILSKCFLFFVRRICLWTIAALAIMMSRSPIGNPLELSP